MGLFDRIIGFVLTLVDRIAAEDLPIVTPLIKLAGYGLPFEDFKRKYDSVDDAKPAKKAAHFWEIIGKDWLFGRNRCLYWSMKGNDGGDMAIWHGMAVATAALRHDKAMLDRLLGGSEVLQYLGGNSRLCRGADVQGGPMRVGDPNRKYYYYGGYVFIDDVSESTLIGHLWGLWWVWDQSPREDVNDRVRKMIVDLADQVIADDYQLKNQDGSTARFGDLRPLKWPWQIEKRKPIGTAALVLLLLMAYNASKRVEFRDRYLKIARENIRSIVHLETRFLTTDKPYDDILGVMVGSMLMMNEWENHDLREAYRGAMLTLWKKVRKQGNPFYIYVMRDALGAEIIDESYLAQARQTLDEYNAFNNDFPTGVVKLPVKNSDTIPGVKWGKHTVSRQPVPVYRRPASDFYPQRSPYVLDDEEKKDEQFNRLDFVVQEALGRHCKALPEVEL